MKKLSIVSILCLSIIMIFGSLISNDMKAAAPKVEYLGKIQYGAYIVGKFKVNGEIAFCLDHVKQTPPTGAPYANGNAYKNEQIRAILYYGYGGPGNEIGNGDTALVATTIALDSIMNNNHSTGRESIPGYKKLMAHAKAKDAPSTSIGFNKKEVTSKVSGNLQKSETIVFKADPKNSIKLNVPSEVTLHKDNKKYSSSSVTIKGGESFYLTAPLDYAKQLNFKNIKPSLGKYQSILFTSSNSKYQRLGSGLLLDPEPVESLSIKFEKRQRNIKVVHKEKFEGEILETATETKNIGTNYSYAPKDKIVKGGKTYVPVKKDKKTGTLGTKDITLVFEYVLQRKVTVLHKDNRDKSLIKEDVYTKKQGDKYTYSPLTNLKKGKYTYRAVSKKVSGTVGKENITVTLYYDVPLIETKLEKLQVYTAAADKGLPVKVALSKTNVYKNNTPGMTTAKIDVSLYEGKTKLDSKTYTAQSLPKSINFLVDPKTLKVNTNKAYTVKLEGYNKNDFDISIGSILTTKGYTSSEEKISVNMKDLVKKKGSISRVIMTEVTPTTKMRSYFETATFSGDLLKKRKTGYGLEQNLIFAYENMLNKSDDHISFDFKVPSQLLDTYLNYKINKGLAAFPMDVAASKKSQQVDKMIQEMTFQFPHVNVERETGSLFTDQQVASKDKRIKHALRDGGNRFYTPIWAELGDYDVSYVSNQIGVNKVTIEIKDNLNLYASMYAHMDSDTIDQDEILLTPINADDPFPTGIPKGWTKEDINWLRSE
ncbi:thioester domain-containing protein [Bacillus pumilus]|uniref:thioester domain-containing protein n=1 Tax=Bacillus pumilus TaxID=1408 RepID=UPI0011A71FB8|nr:thioester domain-containing protein [Bacillus pumilus]